MFIFIEMKKIAVYCGSSVGVDSIYSDKAKELGEMMAELSIGLVYGGASIGLMGTIADRVLEKGGEVHGVIPEFLDEVEITHNGLTQLHKTKDMPERKQIMYDLSDGFIAMPGGFGTLEEIIEVITWAQLGFHKKPCAFYNVNGFYQHLMQFFQHAKSQQFIKAEHTDMLIIDEDAQTLLQAMLKYQAKAVAKWIM